VKSENVQTRKKNLITIDGPSASGKSSLSQGLARKLGWKWLSTGVFYRALAWLGIRHNLRSEEHIVALVNQQDTWSVCLGEIQTLFFYQEPGGEKQDKTLDISTEAIDIFASDLAKSSQVREALLPVQRNCFINCPTGLIAEGRDCGTVVFPEADLKVYLQAADSVRAYRRASQRASSDVDRVEVLQKKRDERDTHRVNSPLRRPEGAFIIDSGTLSLEEMVNQTYQRFCELS